MPEEQIPPMRNKGMLIVAVVVAVLTVILSNIQASRIRSESEGEKVYLFSFTRNMKPGEKIDAKRDVEPLLVEKHFGENIKGVFTGREAADVDTLDGKRISRGAERGDYLLWAHVQAKSAGLVTERGDPSKSLWTVQVDPEGIPGDILQVGDQVNLVGLVSLNGGPLKSYRIIEGVQVVGIGGAGPKEATVPANTGGTSARASKSYRSITIAVPPEEVLVLNDVSTHVVGGFKIETLHPLATVAKPNYVNEQLRHLTALAPRGASGGMMPPG